MKMGLFIPCYIDRFYAQVAISMGRLLPNLCRWTEIPWRQTCPGHGVASAGFTRLNAGCNRDFLKMVDSFDCVAASSGSPVFHLKNHPRMGKEERIAMHFNNKTRN
jgi:L-lactate dehydrogenase complex protein LldE